MSNFVRERNCADCYPIKIKEVCNGVGKNLEDYQKKLIQEAGGRYVSKPKVVMKILRLFFEGESNP